MKTIKDSLKKIAIIIAKLDKEYAEFNRKFTLDGHLLGSMAEVYAAKKYELELLKSSEKGHDAKDINNNFIQIKVTQRNSIGLRHKPDNLLVLKLNPKTFEFVEIYYGNGEKPWLFANKPNSAGQRIITLNKLKTIKKPIT